MPQVQVGFHAVRRYVTLTVFIRIQGARVDVYVWVKLLYCNLIASRLQQFPDAGRDYALS